MEFDYDLLVIGAGPGGYVAAIRAAQLGLKTAVIEKDKAGGVCLNIGCIPSKSLIHQAELFQSVKKLESYGIKCDLSEFDYSKVFQKSRDTADNLCKGVMFLLKKNKIDFIPGDAKIARNHEITLNDGRKITGKYILIATGSSPKEIPSFPFDEDRILSSTGALMLKKLPKKLLILGAGAIGMEFAYIMNSFGVEVHVVEMMDHILPMEDMEISQLVQRMFKRSKVNFYTSTTAISFENSNESLKVNMKKSNGQEFSLEVDKILVAIGRKPNTEHIGLEEIGINTEKGFIPTGDYYETSVPGIFAIGDVINTPLLAHVASKEGEIAVEYMAGHNPEKRIDYHLIPSAVYCEPQIGSFGYSEEEVKKLGKSYKKATFPYRGAGKSTAIEKPDGLVKILYDEDERMIIGAHITGAEATELIHEILLAKSGNLSHKTVASMVHAHPTLSETIMEAMRAIDGMAIHV